MTALLAHLLTALALFPASCGVTSANGLPHVTTHTAAGWNVTACIFTKPGQVQTGYAKVAFHQPPPQSCTMEPPRRFPDWGDNTKG